jgi:hypothetical protein
MEINRPSKGHASLLVERVCSRPETLDLRFHPGSDEKRYRTLIHKTQPPATVGWNQEGNIVRRLFIGPLYYSRGVVIVTYEHLSAEDLAIEIQGIFDYRRK